MITIHEVIQGTPEWHALRGGKYSGSNAYKLLGSFGANEYAKAIEQSFKGNFYTKRGHILEPEAIEFYEKITSVPVGRPGLVSNSAYPTAVYSPDGLTSDRVIEVKCFNEVEHMKIYNGDIGIKVLAQIHFGLMICEKKAAHLVIYNPSLDAKRALKIIDIKYNKAIADNFRRILA